MSLPIAIDDGDAPSPLHRRTDGSAMRVAQNQQKLDMKMLACARRSRAAWTHDVSRHANGDESPRLAMNICWDQRNPRHCQDDGERTLPVFEQLGYSPKRHIEFVLSKREEIMLP